MTSSKTIQVVEKSDQETLRELSNLAPNDCLNRIAEELRRRLNCETACILLWYEAWPAERRLRKEGKEEGQLLITEYDNGMPERLQQREDHSEIYRYGEGITGGYIFEQQKSIRARIYVGENRIVDDEAQCEVRIKDTNWHNMQRFAEESKYKDFRSLLGLPLLVKSRRIGVVKLINKLYEKDDTLHQDGFSHLDLERVKTFLSTIELVIENKTNEGQNESLFQINQKVTGADFNYDELLQEVARSCADTLNFRICIIKLVEHKKLTIKGNSHGPSESQSFVGSSLSEQVLQTRSEVIRAGDAFHALLKSLSIAGVDISEFQAYGINSFLGVPVIYQERVVGVIECYRFLPHDWSSQNIAGVRAYGNVVAALFQRNRMKDALAGLVESFSLLGSSEDVYERVIRLIQDFLDTENISLWEKKVTPKGFEFLLSKRGGSFPRKYAERGLETLTESSLTARVAHTNEIRHLTRVDLENEQLEHRSFISENNLQSLTIVPISIGGQTNAVIHVFYDEDKTLLKEESDFLHLLAARAAAAIWIKRLTLSFKAISDVTFGAPSVGSVLKRIADVARAELYSDLVIVFHYDVARRKLSPPTWSGSLEFIRDIDEGLQETDRDFVNLMLGEKKPLYLEGIEAYKEFCQHKGTVRPWQPEDFWHREHIQSMAAVRLDDGRKNPVGVVFFNYRSPFKFGDSTRRIIESFASQAASAIVIASASFKGMRHQELLTEQIAVKLLDRLGKIISVRTLSEDDGQEESGTSADASVENTREAETQMMRDLYDEVKFYRHHFTVESDFEFIDIHQTIETALAFFTTSIQTTGLRIDHNNQPELPLFCDSKQLLGMLYLLITILLEAKSSTTDALKIRANFNKSKDSIIIRLALVGGRVSNEELENILTQPLFGSGSDDRTLTGRLEFCEILAQSHGGYVRPRRSPRTFSLEVKLRSVN
jgi:GAF domain-containing protein